MGRAWLRRVELDAWPLPIHGAREYAVGQLGPPYTRSRKAGGILAETGDPQRGSQMTESTPPPDQRWSTGEPAATDPARAPAPASSTAAVVTAGRPGIVTAGSITLIVLGALTLLFGVLFILFGALFAGAGGSGADVTGPPGMEGMMAAFAGMLIFIAILVLVFGALEIWAGINALGGRSWARISGMVLSVIGAALFVGGLFGARGEGANPILNIVFIAAYLFVVFALATGGRWFTARSA